MNEDSPAEQAPELPVLSIPRSKVHFVSSPDEVQDALAALMGSKGQIAIDAERASGFKYSQRAYLVQLKSETSDIFLIDPVTIPEIVASKPFRELASFLNDREWILHAATQDLACLEEIGLKPGAIFDTELAARLAGQSRVGLGSLTESLLSLKLAKEHSAADWSTRPLPESWLNYAALDVDVLHDLSNAVNELLIRQQKQSFAAEEFEALLSFKPKPPKLERWRGITGLHKVTDALILEVARQLWQAREALAIKMDVAPGRLIPDAAILAAATEKPKSKPELASMRSFTGRASRSYLATWWDAIQSAYRATELPNLRPEKTDAIPNHRNWSSKFPEADKRLRFAKQALQELSEKMEIPIENLLTPDVLRQVSFTPPESSAPDAVRQILISLGARSWQANLTAELIVEAFSQSLVLVTDSKESAPPE